MYDTKGCFNIIFPSGDFLGEITNIEFSGEIMFEHSFGKTQPLVPHVKVEREDNYIVSEVLVFIDSEGEN